MEGAIGILLDGTGYGTDGQLWGFEVVVGNYANYRRHYQLAAVPLPGGEYAIRNPFVTAVAYLSFFLGRRGEQIALELFPQYPSEVALTKQLMAAGVNCPLSSSCGRLFDAVAAILGVCHHNTYEGQAPSELSSLVPWVQSFDSFIPMENVTSYPYIIDGAEINPAPLLEAIIADLLAGTEIANIAWRFHETIVSMVREAAALVRAATGLNCVVLSGGSWQNRYLLERTIELLTEDGFQVYSHYLVPANDGGLALGQALVALK